MSILTPSFDSVLALLDHALQEDIGRGDLTSTLIIPAQTRASFAYVPRNPMIVCGLSFISAFLDARYPDIDFTLYAEEGAHVAGSTPLLKGTGNAHDVLAFERITLNFLQHLSGIATLTSQYVEAVKGTQAKILDTRKTLPGYRDLAKYAVATGGGHNHRFRLDDGVLIKDNHISIAGNIAEAVKRAKRGTPLLTAIEVECETLTQVKEALEAGATMLMLDNMSVASLKEAVAYVNGRVPLEASGTVSLETVRNIADTGVDYISVGKLTHSASACDIGLDILTA